MKHCHRRTSASAVHSPKGLAAMKTLIEVDDAARSLAETRVPGSTRPGGHHHLSEAWRTMLQRQVHGLEHAAARSTVDTAAGAPLAA